MQTALVMGGFWTIQKITPKFALLSFTIPCEQIEYACSNDWNLKTQLHILDRGFSVSFLYELFSCDVLVQNFVQSLTHTLYTYRVFDPHEQTEYACLNRWNLKTLLHILDIFEFYLLPFHLYELFSCACLIQNFL